MAKNKLGSMAASVAAKGMNSALSKVFPMGAKTSALARSLKSKIGQKKSNWLVK